ncbi:putative phosphorylase b kinase regulatory subunit beta [Trichinella pseudospiralis]|uniref:Phosphorylase b kinase regulatory subunit n=1 Tax=Trichinella pseudospiralis TaxID=6337 RepID=A0A0V0YE61_TRIPS|nr:putative phosphorylase b kinase regulatory subunit beta [Trichinella pseudospiralis]
MYRKNSMLEERPISPDSIQLLHAGMNHSVRLSASEKIASQQQLDYYYAVVKKQILQFQSYTTGLFPRYSTENNVGYVRDSLYCAMTCWALSRGYLRLNDDQGRYYELGQAAVKTMRGILLCWMRQSDKVENFKRVHSAVFALHSKFNLLTGEAVEGTENYGHLQIDVVALFILTLVQMITSGLEIIYTTDEVSFVQNIVFYIERAYRTPDFGMWEMGTRYNDGTPELHASSIGMVKAALEAINGCNLYGSKGTVGSVIYVDIDAHNRNRTTFETLLPRESNSKNVDASLIPTISFPCFAAHDESLHHRTFAKCIRKLKGKYGFKRFLRDGQFCVLENPNRQFYQSGETKLFQGVECQWPMFFVYMIIDGVYMGNQHQKQSYRIIIIFKLKVFITSVLILDLRSCCQAWARDFSYGAKRENLIHVSDIDPSYRHLPANQRPKVDNRHSVFQGSLTNPVLQIAFITESQKLQTMLSTYGITTQTLHQVEPVQIWSPGQMVKVFENLGKNVRLQLSGRPNRPLGALGTSKVYRVFGETVLCYPLLFDVQDFYLSSDAEVLIDDIKRDLKFIECRWQLAGRPTICLLLTEDLVCGEHFSKVLNLLVDLKSGLCNGIRVRVGRLQNLLSAGCLEHLDFAPQGYSVDFIPEPMREVKSMSDYSSLSDLSHCLMEAVTDKDFDVEPFKTQPTEEIIATLKNLPKAALYTQCRRVVRYCAALLRKVVDSLAPSITSILVRGKRLTVGVFGGEEVIIDSPVTPNVIEEELYRVCFPHDILACVLQQELIIVLGHFISVEPELFIGILKVRIGTAMQQRQLNGSLNRVPPDFFEHMWRTLERTSDGIVVATHHLPQQPTLSDMTEYELNFALTIDELLSRIQIPEYRQIMVELFVVLSIILQRNPELKFNKKVDMDKLISKAFGYYADDKKLTDRQDMTPFYELYPHLFGGSSTYLAKAVINDLLSIPTDSVDSKKQLSCDTNCRLS